MVNKSNFVNGIPELLVLRLLSRHEMYGYQLVSEISARSSEALSFGEGCIYPILHRLVAKKYLTTRKELVDGRIRHYYRATEKGKLHAETLHSEWSRVVSGVGTVLEAQYV